jgi:hypothetical protein
METNEIEARIKDLERRVNSLTLRLDILVSQVDRILERINKSSMFGVSSELPKFKREEENFR